MSRQHRRVFLLGLVSLVTVLGPLGLARAASATTPERYLISFQAGDDVSLSPVQVLGCEAGPDALCTSPGLSWKLTNLAGSPVGYVSRLTTASTGDKYAYSFPQLRPGDVLHIYRSGAQVLAVPYRGVPSVKPRCGGRSFTGRLGAGQAITGAAVIKDLEGSGRFETVTTTTHGTGFSGASPFTFGASSGVRVYATETFSPIVQITYGVGAVACRPNPSIVPDRSKHGAFTRPRLEYGGAYPPVPLSLLFRAYEDESKIVIKFDRLTVGHRRGARCAAGRRRGARRCTRTHQVRRTTMPVLSDAGATVPTVVHGKRLAVGSYRLVVVMIDGEGHKSRPYKLPFEIF